MESNIKINYCLLEEILRLTGTYRYICAEYEFIAGLLVEARKGKFSTMFEDEETMELALDVLEKLTGVSEKYWTGERRIKLGVTITDKLKAFEIDDQNINKVDLTTDYDRLIYKQIILNPLNLDHEELYLNIKDLHRSEIEYEVLEEEALKLKEVYSLKSLLIMRLINMEDTETVELIDKANVYRHKKWEPYMKSENRIAKQGNKYSPKYTTFNAGLVQTIIRNILDLGFLYTFRDLDKEFTI